MSKADDLAPVMVRKMEQLEQAVHELIRRQEEGFYTVDEFSRITGLSENTLSKYCRDSVLAATKVGGQWLVPRWEFRRLCREAIANHDGKLRSTARRDRAVLKHLGLV